MVTYNEFLPHVIGSKTMERFDLGVRTGNEYTQYDETVQATLVNEFATAAYRFGHSMINSFFQDIRGEKKTKGNTSKGNNLREMFQYPFELYTGQLDGVIGGLLLSKAQRFDR